MKHAYTNIYALKITVVIFTEMTRLQEQDIYVTAFVYKCFYPVYCIYLHVRLVEIIQFISASACARV